jgi:KRAB domain-containing zinc finger protein
MLIAHPPLSNNVRSATAVASAPAPLSGSRCPLCDAALINRQALRYHLYKHAGLRPYRCEDCTAAFRTPSTLKAHVEVQHCSARGAAAADTVPFTTLKARVETPNVAARGAANPSRRRHCCPVCGLVASTSGKLKLHQLRHTAEIPFQCEVCGARFRQRSVLRVHEFTHSRISPHKCSQCGRCFATKSKLGEIIFDDKLLKYTYVVVLPLLVF